MGQISLILAQISQALAGASGGSVLAILAFCMEAIMKLWPTANPQGFLIAADALLKKCGAIVVQIGGLISQAGDVVKKLDDVIAALIPHNIKS